MEAIVAFFNMSQNVFRAMTIGHFGAYCGGALKNGTFHRSKMVYTQNLYNYVELGLLPIKNIYLHEKFRRNTKQKSS